MGKVACSYRLPSHIVTMLDILSHKNSAGIKLSRTQVLEILVSFAIERGALLPYDEMQKLSKEILPR